MAGLDFCSKHNMVAYLEKNDGNTEFHQIMDFLTHSSIHFALTVSPIVSTSFVEQFWTSAKSRTVNNISYIDAIVAGKPVTISEASIRSDLLFDDADGIDTLNNQAIFDTIYSKSTSWDQIPTNIATAVICLATNQKYNFSKLIFDGMMRHLDASKKFVMYPRFLQIFLRNQLRDVPVPMDHFPVPALTKKVLTFMVKKEGSGGNHGGQSSSDRSLSGNEDGLTLQSVYDLCVSLCKQVTAQAAEIKDLKAQIKQLKKKARPVINHHKSCLGLLGRRKQQKTETHTDWDALDTDLEATLNEAMDYTLAQDEGKTDSKVEEPKTSSKTEELHLSGDTLVVEDKGSAEKGGSTKGTDLQQSTVKPDESTVKPDESTVKPDEGTDKQDEGTDRQVEGTAENKDQDSRESATPTATSTPTPIVFGEMMRLLHKIEAIMIFLAFASYMGFIVYQMDVKSAFLYGTIDEEVYVSQHLGFVDPKHPNKVYKVVKALYGLHQAHRAWYATLSAFLEQIGYRRGTIDKNLFIKNDKKDIMLVQVYVDDIIFCSTKKSWCDELEALMKSRFQMSSIGELTFFLRLQVKQKEDGIFDGMVRHLDASKKFVMYPRFLQIFLRNQLRDVPIPMDHFPVPALTKMVLTFMVKKGKNFSGNATPLFNSMLVQPTEDEGEVSKIPSESQPIPSLTHPSEDQPESQPDPSLRPSSSIPIPDSNPEGSGGNHGGHSSSDRSLLGNEDGLTLQSVYDLCVSLCIQVTAQAAEIKDLKAQIRQLKKKAKPVINHHKAWFRAARLKKQQKKKDMEKLKKRISLHGSSGVHTLMTEAGLVIHMLVEKKYPLRKKLASPKQTALGKDFSNQLMANSLPKTIWLSIHMFYYEELAIPRQTETGKESSNPFMAEFKNHLSDNEESLGGDASKQGRIDDVDAEVTFIDETLSDARNKNNKILNNN
ncbi:putative ribonuclease H-like domain-containing protein [Tanacetum coccineum]|uniref:Ribonuclease H-like domain-containing protein n=1 Tax=Tanacetum coccineum TaxID=301880 RepID=A0ABQ5C1J5_9ASTR